VSVTSVSPYMDSIRRVSTLKGLTPVGLAPDTLTNLTPQMASDLLFYATYAADSSDWLVADLLIWLEHRVSMETGLTKGREFWNARNDKWVQFLAASKQPYTFHTLYSFSATAKAFPWHRRRYSPAISFEHYRLLASKDEAVQEKMLDEVEDMELTVSQLRQILYGKLSEDGEKNGLANKTALPATCPNCGFILEGDEE